ncbi:MAG: redoxin domain-containing protein, partial [Phycisphaerales bacterium]|nr:redoxin domain-containing protein [Phycisphaerales bacterium]
ATWCGPCRASMPHISGVQQKYKDYDVQIIGISDEDLPTVVGFLTKADQEKKLWWDKIEYTLATDPDRSVYKDYMEAAGQNGIPTAFIVGTEGKIEWIGHPMGIDEPLDQVVKDTWDRNEFKMEFEKEAKAAREAMNRQRAIGAAMQAGDHAKALSIIDEMLAEEANKDNMGLEMYKFRLLLNDMKAPTKAYAFADDIITNHWNDPQGLNAISWYIADTPNLPERNLNVAMKAAMRASELTDHKDPAILDTVGRVFFEQGKFADAVKWQKKAVANAEGDMATELMTALKKYEAAAK